MRGFRYNSVHCRQSKTGCKAANAKVFFVAGRSSPATTKETERAMIASMTGFAAATREVAGGQLAVELKSVNHRYLEFQCRLADDLRALEPVLREAVAAGLARGKVDCRLTFTPAAAGERALVPDGKALAALAEASAMVAGTFDRYRKLGKFGYVLGVLQTLMKIKPIEAAVTIDGKPKKEPALMVMFARSRYYAGGMKVSPNSDPLADSARMIFLKWMSRPVFLTVFPRVYSGSHLKVSYVEECEVRRLEIATPGVPIDVEGEYVGVTPCVFSVTDRYISIV